MNLHSFENLKSRVHRRVEYLQSQNFNVLHTRLRQFFFFFDQEPLLVEIGGRLDAVLQSSDTLLTYVSNPNIGVEYSSEEDAAAVAYFILRRAAAERVAPRGTYEQFHTLQSISHEPTTNQNHRDELTTETFKALFLEPFYLYVIDQLENHKAILSLLLRYKHRTEWFHRERLSQLYSSDIAKGEKNLALDLYEYLYDRGVQFSIEPSSLDGKIDLIAAQNSDDPLLADAKIFKGDKGYICRGFGQLYRYTTKYNEPIGYLVIFNPTDIDLVFTDTDTDIEVPALTFNKKRIYFITIDICEERQSPSKAGRIKRFEVNQEELFAAVNPTELAP